MFLFNSCRKSQSKYVYQAKKKNKDDEYQIDEFPSTQKLPDSIQSSESVIKIKKSDFEKLVRKNSKTNEKFVDFEFPPNASSLGDIEEIGNNYEWKRISEIIEEPTLYDEKVSPSDVIADHLQKCYFLSSIAALAEDQQNIFRLFEKQQYNPLGIYKLNLRQEGVIKEIIVDDYVPVDLEGKPLFCHPKKNQFWVMIIQKAWAKINGSYKNILDGSPSQVFKAITYAPTKVLSISGEEANRETVWAQIKQEVSRKHPICVGTSQEFSIEQQESKNGLLEGHFYTVIGAGIVKTQDTKQSFRILKLRNPWGIFEWEGKFVESDTAFWERVSPEDKKKIWEETKVEKDGIFFIEWTDFCKYFETAHFCYVEPNPYYEVQPIYPDRKHGNIHLLTIKQKGQYIIELHQSLAKLNNKDPTDKMGIKNDEANRATIFILKASDFSFITGAFTYDEHDTTFRTELISGKYLIYTKIDPITQNSQNKAEWIYPRKCSLSIYSKYLISNLKQIDKKKISPDTPFYHKMFIEEARNNKKKQFDKGKLWISWRQFLVKAGFAYICFGVELESTNKLVVSCKEKDFNEIGYTLKKPHKGKKQIKFQVKPGQEIFLIARIGKDIKKRSFEFPPPLQVKIKGLKQPSFPSSLK